MSQHIRKVTCLCSSSHSWDAWIVVRSLGAINGPDRVHEICEVEHYPVPRNCPTCQRTYNRFTPLHLTRRVA